MKLRFHLFNLNFSMKTKLFFLFLVYTQCVFGQISLQNLKTENLINPIGTSIKNPRFSWQLVSEKRNSRQSTYEIEVRSGKNLVWSSGKIASETSVFNEYKGSPLQSNTKYTWQVRVSDNQNNTSPWATASFQTALLNNATDWKAAWISSGIKADTVNGIVPRFKRTFSSKKKVVSATAFITARGLYEAQINGKKIGDAFLTPGWTSYNKHLQYQTYDVSSLLNAGENNIDVLLGSGWYRTRLAWTNQQNIYGKETALLFQLEIKYQDGSSEIIKSDGSWKVSETTILASEIYNGEIQDSRKAETAATMAVERDYPKDYLTSAINEPIRKHEILKPIKVLISPKGETILDFGQNLVGWVKAKVNGVSGDKITFSHVEMLDKKGIPYFENLRSAKAQAIYYLKGGAETLEPHFTFFGFRYVKVEGIATINLADFEAIALYSDMTPTGTFECSNPLVNQLQKNIQWSQRGNFLDVPTDCPQRDERLGWTGDAEVFSRTAAYNFNVNQFFAKWLKDVAADQKPNGSVPFVVPDVLANTTMGLAIGAAGWSDASIIIPYNTFVAYGDKKVLETQYPSMKAYSNYVRKTAVNDLWNMGFQFADWLSYRVDDSKDVIGQRSAVTDNYLVAQCFYAYNTEIMIKTAKILGKTEDVADYESLLNRITKAFQVEYMTANGRLISNTQTAYILALQFDMIPENLRSEAVERLVENIKSYNYHLTTGFLGTPFLNPVLTRFGKNDVAFKLLLQETYPSWIYPIKAHGATTIWERWDSMKPDSSFQDPGMTSFNHYAYGAVGDWMYRTIAGIDTQEGDGAGYKSIKIQPQMGGGLTHSKGSLMTNYGSVVSSWKLVGQKLTLGVEIPANTSARVYFPTEKADSIFENGAKVSVDVENSIQVGSGKYSFEMEI